MTLSIPRGCHSSRSATWRSWRYSGQGEDVGASWAHDDGGDRGVIREGLTVGEVPGKTVGAMDDIGRKGGGAITGDEPWRTKHTQVVSHAVMLKAFAALHSH